MLNAKQAYDGYRSGVPDMQKAVEAAIKAKQVRLHYFAPESKIDKRFKEFCEKYQLISLQPVATATGARAGQIGNIETVRKIAGDAVVTTFLNARTQILEKLKAANIPIECQVAWKKIVPAKKKDESTPTTAAPVIPPAKSLGK